MRFYEFKIIKEADEASGFYTIGDSHAVAVATAGGKGWTNLAIGGKSSTDAGMLANISKVPKGAVVLVSQGANDTANAMRAYMDSQGKRPLKPAQTIAANVANVVDKVKAQGATVIFMLFPNGPGRGAGLAKYYGGDYQEDVRNAIKSAISGVQIIDINGKPLTDGVHATMGVYKEVAGQVMKSSKPSVAPAGAAGQGASPDAGVKSKTAFSVDVPGPGRKGADIADLQKALVALGYPLPKYGVDGIVGTETRAAVSAFQQANSLTVDGDAGPETIAALNNVLKSKPEIAGKLTKSTAADVKGGGGDVPNFKDLSGNAKGGAGATGSAKEAVEFFKSKGWTAEQAAGIVGNLQAESGSSLRIDAVGDGGKAYGIAQWHPDRQAKFAKIAGKDIRQSTFQEQLAFVNWELNNTEAKAGAIIKKAKTAEEAAWLFDEYYERSSGAHRQKRIDNALALLSTSTTTA
jgi:hypothetical protein